MAVLPILALVVLASFTATPAWSKEIIFSQDVAPILVDKCSSCHNERTAKGDYDVSSYEFVTEAVEAGDPDSSMLFYVIAQEDPEQRMPKDKDCLPPEQVELIRQWISDGAKYDLEDPGAPLQAIAPRKPQGTAPESYPIPVPVAAVVFTPQAGHIIAGGYHELTVWNVVDGTLANRISGIGQRTHGLAFSPDGKFLAVASGTPGKDGSVHIVEYPDTTAVREIAVSSETCFGIAFSPDGQKLATAGGDGCVRIFNVNGWNEEMVIRQHDDWAVAVAWNFDGSRLVSASRDKTAKIYNMNTGEIETTYVGHEQPVYRVAFTADGKHVWSSGADNNLRKWNSAPSLEREMSEKGKDPKTVAVIGGAERAIYAMDLKGDNLFSGSSDRNVRQHHPANQTLIRSYHGHTDSVYSISYHENTRRLATGSYNGEIRLFDAASGKLTTKITAAPGYQAASF